jgi:Flp pilus assembly protein TadG
MPGVLTRRTARFFARIGRADAGHSAVEFALIGSLFVVLLLNVVDFASKIWAKMEIENAAQAGVQAAYKTCSPGKMPAKANCPTMDVAILAAAQSSSLGSAVVLKGDASEDYFCPQDNKLVAVAAPLPADCSAFGSAGKPGDYVTVTVKYPFKPFFAGLSLVDSETLEASGIARLQ